jgi:hypothetical protein
VALSLPSSIRRLNEQSRVKTAWMLLSSGLQSKAGFVAADADPAQEARATAIPGKNEKPMPNQ